MAAARHPMPPDIAALSLDEIAERYIGRFRDKIPDWEAFEDAKIEGYRRAQHRFIGAGGSGKHVAGLEGLVDDCRDTVRRSDGQQLGLRIAGRERIAELHEIDAGLAVEDPRQLGQ